MRCCVYDIPVLKSHTHHLCHHPKCTVLISIAKKLLAPPVITHMRHGVDKVERTLICCHMICFDCYDIPTVDAFKI